MKSSKKVTERFREAVRFLLAKREVETQQEFAKSMGIKSSAFSSMLRGTSNVTLDHVVCVIRDFNINPNFIFLGEMPIQSKGDMKGPNYPALLDELKEDFTNLSNEFRKIHQKVRDQGVVTE